MGPCATQKLVLTKDQCFNFCLPKALKDFQLDPKQKNFGQGMETSALKLNHFKILDWEEYYILKCSFYI